MRSLLRIAGGALLLTLALAPRNALAATTGNIEGVVTDQATGKKLAGVTVTVTSPALQGEQTEFTDAGGHYIITELPPGEYLVRFYFSNINVERPGVFIQADKTLPVNVAIPTQKAEVKTYRITEKAPTVDVGNTQVQTQVTSELVRNTPVRGRTYDAVLALAPGASTDATGFEFNGATGLENNFLIDGVNTTAPAFGNLGTQLTLEFIGETEIITGGYNAEYGRATGGVVNVITKSGSNQFHGDLWFYTTPFQLEGPYLGRSGEAIATKSHTKYAIDFGFDLGGPIVKDKVWFYVGFAPTFTTNETTRFIRTRTALQGDGTASYPGDLDPNVSCPAYIDKTFCNSLNSGNAQNPPLLAPGYITKLIGGFDTKYDTDVRLYNWIAKFNFQLNPNNSLVLQYIGSPGTSNGITTTSAGVTGQQYFGSLNGTASQLQGSQFDNTHDALLHFVSKLADRRLQLDVVAGYHYGDHTTTPATKDGLSSSVVDTNLRSLAAYEPNITPCNLVPAGQPNAGFNPCPVQNYSYGGFGYLQHSTEQRVSAQASATYFARLGGTHALKIGFDFEDNIYKDNRRYTDGAAYTIGTDGTIKKQTYASKLPDAADGRGMVQIDGFTATTQTLNYSVYARDSYNVGFVPGLTINAGFRWEAQQVKDINGDIAIGIYDNWAPRVGAVYDWTRKGRSKIYVSYGWFYESIPLDINDRQFSGEGIASQRDKFPSTMPAGTPGFCNYGGMGFVDPKTACTYLQPRNAQVNGGTFGQVSPKLRGMYSEEVVAGLQYDVGLDMVLGAAYIHRDLGRIIEDMSPDGGNTYIVANPGDTTDQGTVKDLENKIKNTSDAATKAKLQQQLGLYQAVQSFPKAKRNYDALVITATKRLSHNFLLLASYTYSRTIGNYPGLFSASNGQTDPNISSQFDLRELLLNRNGPLPSDRPHNLKIQGSYFVPFGANTMVFGLAFNGVSGRPIEVLGTHPFYGPDEVFILPRGSGGRTPFVTSFDLHVSYRRQLSRLFGFEAYADVFNLFNQQQITNVDDQYTASSVGPIQNGTVSDLSHLKDIGGGQVLLNPNYAHATQYQAPLSMRIGLRLSF